jgi:predicted tellurium resistance membrane protein TerC
VQGALGETCQGEAYQRESKTAGQAIRIIVLSEIVMSADILLAVAGTSQGNLFLLLFGLGLSILLAPFAGSLSMLTDKYPILTYAGAAVLGRAGGQLIISDPALVGSLNPPIWLRISLEVLFACGAIVAGKLWVRWIIMSESAIDGRNTV